MTPSRTLSSGSAAGGSDLVDRGNGCAPELLDRGAGAGGAARRLPDAVTAAELSSAARADDRTTRPLPSAMQTMNSGRPMTWQENPF